MVFCVILVHVMGHVVPCGGRDVTNFSLSGLPRLPKLPNLNWRQVINGMATLAVITGTHPHTTDQSLDTFYVCL